MKKYYFFLIPILILSGCSSYYLSQKDDPCNDKILIMLEQKDSLTIDEMKIYSELKALCVNNANNKRFTDQSEKTANALSTWLYFSVIVITGGLVALAIK